MSHKKLKIEQCEPHYKPGGANPTTNWEELRCSRKVYANPVSPSNRLSGTTTNREELRCSRKVYENPVSPSNHLYRATTNREELRCSRKVYENPVSPANNRLSNLSVLQ